MFALLLTLASFAQDVDAASVEVGALEFELPGVQPADPIVIGFDALSDGSIEVHAGRIDPYKTFKFTVSFGGGAAAWEVYDLCLDDRCPDALVEVGGDVWVYAAETSSAASESEWKYVPVRRMGL